MDFFESSTTWHYFNSRDFGITQRFDRWQGVEYDIIGDGTFEYPTLKQQAEIRNAVKSEKL